ncbi:MAG TPA: PadR family transcriptional regulator [Acidimicrobiales bacterium]
MTRIFRRGELTAALLQVVTTTGPTNGYAIMQHLNETVGAGWQASPGAVYPALLALEDLALITGHDENGSRLYRVTESGRRACDDRSDLLDKIARRASNYERRTTLGAVLDTFARQATNRSVPLDPTQERDIDAILTTTGRALASVLEQGENNE